LRVEDRTHPATRLLPATFRSSPNEWYRWEKDLRENPDIDILLSIDSTSFPLGTGPKPHEIWHGGYYPVVWTNKKYRMISDSDALLYQREAEQPFPCRRPKPARCMTSL
jgi:uncharacterized protein